MGKIISERTSWDIKFFFVVSEKSLVRPITGFLFSSKSENSIKSSGVIFCIPDELIIGEVNSDNHSHFKPALTSLVSILNEFIKRQILSISAALPIISKALITASSKSGLLTSIFVASAKAVKSLSFASSSSSKSLLSVTSLESPVVPIILPFSSKMGDLNVSDHFLSFPIQIKSSKHS